VAIHPSRFLRTALLGAIVVLALALRLWNLQFGLPEWYHPDELLKARAIARIASGDLHPGSFYHPSFMLYASAMMLRLQHADGSGIDEQSAVRAGRLMVALLGTATVGLTFLAGARAYGATAGLIAALLLAVAPLHVVCSHYLKEDVPLTFWAVATFVTSLGILSRGATRDVTRAAFLAGLAAGTKYTGLLCIALPWMAQRARGSERGPRRVLVAATCGFLLTTPFALIDPVGFVRGAGHEGGNAFTGMAGVRVWPFAYLWTYHLRFSLLPGVGLLPMLAAAVGMISAWQRRTTVDRMLLAIVIALYAIFETSPYKPPPNADRYVLPLLPFVALLGATGLQAAAMAIRDQRLGVALITLVMSAPLLTSMRLTSAMQPDTRQDAAQWLRTHACGQSRIVLEGALNSAGVMVPAYVPTLPSDCPATYVYSLERDRAALEDADFAIATSFMYERYLTLLPPESTVRQFYEQFFATHALVAQFAPRYESYGFHNPTIRIYQLGRGSAAP
jgi:4-amino-4-deoxy-L-arabinose transferase-like glycosyltransferase